MSRAGFWHVDGPYGPERWERADGRFVAVNVGATRLVVDHKPFQLDQIAPALKSACPHPGPWPKSFVRCPECGEKLEPADVKFAPETWPPPSGLPVWPGALQPDPATRRDEVLPASADLCFVVTGAPPHLFAFDLSTGWLWVRNELAGGWERWPQRLAKSSLPRWSWAAAVLTGETGAAPTGRVARGFALPTDEGAVYVDTAVGAAEPIVRPPETLRYPGVGGAAIMAGITIVPVWSPTGLMLIWLSPDGGAWQAVPVANGDTAPASTRFAAPVGHAGDVFWLSMVGKLTAQQGASGRIEARWETWPDQIRPVLGTRPHLGSSGVLSQLVQVDQEQLAFRAINVAGSPQHGVSSFWLSVGQAAFKDGQVKRVPWEQQSGTLAEYAREDNVFLLPLLSMGERGFVVARCSERMQLSKFVDTEAGARSQQHKCELFFTNKRRELAPRLGRSVEVLAAWDLVVFVFRQRLHIYAAGINQCWSWALNAA